LSFGWLKELGIKPSFGPEFLDKDYADKYGRFRFSMGKVRALRSESRWAVLKFSMFGSARHALDLLNLAIEPSLIALVTGCW